ncbi:MAG: metallophosphoesterase [Pseudomonadota bacterium]
MTTAESHSDASARAPRTARKSLLALALSALLLGTGLGAWSFLIEPDLVTVTEVPLETSKWPAGRAPLKIVALADLHTGAPHVDVAKLDEVVAEINGLEPDIVVLLGDYVIQGVLGGRFVAPEETARSLAALAPAQGTYAVLGNHDWWHDGDQVRAALESAGIVVLDDQAVRLALPDGPIWIAGIADDMTQNPNPRRVIRPIPKDEPVIAIAHDPAVFPDVPQRVVVTLAGHTHGGQVYIPFYGAPVIPGRAPRRYAYGHIRENGKDLYVSSGLGTSILPVRFNMPPEIAVITLVDQP